MINPVRALQYLRLKSFDTSTKDGLIAERYRRALWGMLANVLSRGAAMLVMVLTVSLTIPYLGAERFGVWMTVASMAGMLMFLDLGIGNALTNRVAHVAASGGSQALQVTISGGLGFLFLVSTVAAFALIGVAGLLPWKDIIKVSNPSLTGEVRNACMTFAGLFGVNLFMGGVQRVFFGLQRTHEAHIAATVSSLLSLVLLVVAAQQEAGITVLLWVTLGCQQLAGFVLLWRLHQQGLLRLSSGAAAIVTERPLLLKTGGLFLVLQLAAIVSVGMDGLLISSVLGSVQVAVYALVQRLFQFVAVPLAIMNAPLWAAYADAHVRREGEFIIHTLQRSLLMTGCAAVVGGGVLLLFSESIVKVWTNGNLSVPIGLAAVYFTWIVIEALGNAFAMALNGCGVVKEQVFVVSALVVFGFAAKILALKLFGIAAMIFSWACVYVFSVLVFYGVLFRERIIKSMRCA